MANRRMVQRSVKTLRVAGAAFAALALFGQAGNALAQDKKDDKPWSISVSGGAEYDSNVSVAQRDVNTGKDDIAAVLDFGAEYRIPGVKPFDIELGYDFSQSLHADLTDFDLQTHLFTASASRDVGEFDVGVRFQHIRTSLGGDGFLRYTSFSPNVGKLFSDNIYVTVAYTYTDKNFVIDQGRDGQNNGASADLFYFIDGPDRFAATGIRIESENTRAAEFDYNGFSFYGAYTTALNLFGRDGELRARYNYLSRNYDNITPSIGVRRDDKRHTFTVSYEIPVVDPLVAKLQYRYLNANSNLPAVDYNESTVTLTIAATF